MCAEQVEESQVNGAHNQHRSFPTQVPGGVRHIRMLRAASSGWLWPMPMSSNDSTANIPYPPSKYVESDNTTMPGA